MFTSLCCAAAVIAYERYGLHSADVVAAAMKKLRVAAERGDSGAKTLLADVTTKLLNAVAIDPGEKDTFAMSDGRVLSTAIMNGRKTRSSTTIFCAGNVP